MKKEKFSKASVKTVKATSTDKRIDELTKTVEQFIKLSQDALLASIAVSAGANDRQPELKVILPPPTKDELILQLGKLFIEAWTSSNNPQNSRQLAVFTRMNKSDCQLLLKQILDYK